jgi:hypothetical protein
LELDGGDDPIRGRLRHGTETTQEFVGWLQLTRAVEDARQGASREQPDCEHHAP